MSKEYKPKPNDTSRCVICGERIGGSDYLGGRVKHGGTRFVHKDCWEREQAERARRTNR